MQQKCLLFNKPFDCALVVIFNLNQINTRGQATYIHFDCIAPAENEPYAHVKNPDVRVFHAVNIQHMLHRVGVYYYLAICCKGYAHRYLRVIVKGFEIKLPVVYGGTPVVTGK